MGEFERELRAQIEMARRDLAAARQADDEPAIRALTPRLHQLLQIAVDHDVAMPDADHTEGIDGAAARPVAVTERDEE